MHLNSDSEHFFIFRYFYFSFKSSLLQLMFNSLAVEKSSPSNNVTDCVSDKSKCNISRVSGNVETCESFTSSHNKIEQRYKEIDKNLKLGTIVIQSSACKSKILFAVCKLGLYQQFYRSVELLV